MTNATRGTYSRGPYSVVFRIADRIIGQIESSGEKRIFQRALNPVFSRKHPGVNVSSSRLARMIRQIAPVFFTLDIPHTLAYYEAKLGFKCLGTWQDPPVYAIVERDQRAIHFRCSEPPGANPDKYADELLDAYLFVEDADALYAEYAAQGVEFVRGLANMPWNSREFVVKDCDGRLLAFGANL